MTYRMTALLALSYIITATSIRAQGSGTSEPTPTEVAVNESVTLEIVGFGDIQATFSESKESSTFGIGQAELDITSGLNDRLAVGLAIAYDQGAFAIGSFTLDYIAWEADGQTALLPAGVSNLTVGGGQFDVPFGIDWHVYASIDRRLISSPLVVENTHNSWNDLGAYATATAGWGSVTAFVANGFCHEGLDPKGEEVCTHNDIACGGRLGLTPHESIEVGGSVAAIFGVGESHDMRLAAADVQFTNSSLELKGEYILHQFRSDESSDFDNDGYYIQGLCGLGDWYLVGRYGEFRPNRRNADIARFSAGIGRTLEEVVELRLEYQANRAADNAAVIQIAFGF